MLAGLMALAEWQAWAFLGSPAQRWLSARTGRTVQLVDEAGQGFALQLWGGIRLSVRQLRIHNPDWAGPAPMLIADDLALRLRWRDALAWRPGRSLSLQQLSARRLDLNLQRQADGRASWTLATTPGQPGAHVAPTDLLTVQQLALDEGRMQWQDAVNDLQLDGRFKLRPPAGGVPGALDASATGRYAGKPVMATLTTGSPAGWLAGAQALDGAVPLSLQVQAGRARLALTGQVRHLLGVAPELLGRYSLSGPSLAAVGEPLGISLPRTHRFAMQGRLELAGRRWSTVVEQATVGASRLAGAFVFERRPGQAPLLQGQLTGQSLLLQDLGPAVGGTTEAGAQPSRTGGRLLPDRRFNLPALRAMDAEVLVALDRLDFGTAQLRAAAPLRGLIWLHDGVLGLEQLHATLAQGELSGRVQLDGRQAPARWVVALQGRQLQIEQALPAARRPGQPPWLSGRLDGQLTLNGSGHSTAELLASATGGLRLQWRQGQVSHLLVEAASLDIAQALGVLVRGDRPLAISCAAADLQVQHGVVSPRVLLVDTRDSLLWVDGSLSLATERLQLQAHVQPKDFSPLSLRTPLHIGGTLGAPIVSLDQPKLLQRLLPAALLALLNPLAGLLPLLDVGGTAGPAVAGCEALVAQRQRPAAAPRP